MRFTVKRLFGVTVSWAVFAGCSSAELAIDLMQKHQRKKIEEKPPAKVVAKPHYKIGTPIKSLEFGIIQNVT